MDLLDTEIGKTLWNLCAQDELPNEPHFAYLKAALREELRDNYPDQMALLLSILYDPQSVQLVRENVETGTTDGIAYALELLDLFVDQELKPNSSRSMMTSPFQIAWIACRSISRVNVTTQYR